MALQAAVRWVAGAAARSPADALLAEIARTGSLNRAVAVAAHVVPQRLGLLGKTQRALGQPLVVLHRGRGARLAPFGENLLRADRAAGEVLARAWPIRCKR